MSTIGYIFLWRIFLACIARTKKCRNVTKIFVSFVIFLILKPFVAWATKSRNITKETVEVLRQSHILTFTLKEGENVTFEIPNSYPQQIPLISLSSSKLVKTKQCLIEDEIRNFAITLVGSPMIMDLVTKLQEILETNRKQNISSYQLTLDNGDSHKMVVIHIDHMRQKNRYLKTLCSWASELNIFGVVLLCCKWIFILFEGSKKQVKEFIIRLKTRCIDVDSSGKPCKEKMSKILYEEERHKCFSSFTVEELETVKCLERYLQRSNLEYVFENALKPLLLPS